MTPFDVSGSAAPGTAPDNSAAPGSAAPEPARALILLRHGKSDYPGGVTDHQRPLAPRGHREAGLAGRWITDHVGRVDAVLCSTSERTRQTLTATGIVAPAVFSDGVYDASPGEVLDAVAAVPDDVRTLLVVGHDPGMPGLALTLADETSDATALSDVRSRFPTSALAVLSVPGSWSDLAASGAQLHTFVVPRI